MKTRRNRRLLVVALILASFLVKTVDAPAQQDDAAQSRLAALAMEQKGQNTEAEAAWGTILKADPRNVEALAHMGLLEARLEHYDAAIDFYRRAIAIDANFPGVSMNLGLALFKAGQFPDAIRMFSAEIKKHPGDQRLTILLGMAHYAMKDYLIAIPYLQRAIERDAANVSLHVAMARSCMLSEQYQCVIDEHDALVASHSDSAEVELLAASALDAIKRPEEAIRELKDALTSNPNEPKLHFALGFLLWSGGKWSEAAEEFQLDLQKNPQDTTGRVYLGDCLLREKQVSQALGELEKAGAAEGQSDALLHFDRGMIYASSNRMEDAFRELKTAAKSDPDNAELHRQIAKLYQSIGRPVEAKQELDGASRMREAHRSLHEMLEPAGP